MKSYRITLGAITVPPDIEIPRPSCFSVRLAAEDDVPAIRTVLFSVRSEYRVIGAMGANDADLDNLAINFFRGGGCFEVVEDATHRVVGCAGLRPINSRRAELCKMYLEKAARGQGLGKRLLEDLLAAARRSGFREVWLETNSVLTEAITLYKKYGFQRVNAEHLPPRCDQAYLLQLETDGGGRVTDEGSGTREPRATPRNAEQRT